MARSLADRVRRLAFERTVRRRTCSHLGDVAERPPPAPFRCDRCVEEGTRTVHLRQCLTCGIVACCESSPGKHGRRHFEETGHPLIESVEPGESWVWCWVDRSYQPGLPN